MARTGVGEARGKFGAPNIASVWLLLSQQRLDTKCYPKLGRGVDCYKPMPSAQAVPVSNSIRRIWLSSLWGTVALLVLQYKCIRRQVLRRRIRMKQSNLFTKVLRDKKASELVALRASIHKSDYTLRKKVIDSPP